jgi:hypothetical protein
MSTLDYPSQGELLFSHLDFAVSNQTLKTFMIGVVTTYKK